MDHQGWHQQLFLSWFFHAKLVKKLSSLWPFQPVLQHVDSSPKLSGEGEQRACGRVRHVPV